MMDTTRTVSQYFGDLDPQAREVLEHVRGIIKAEVPEAEEVMSYGIPTYKYKKKNLVHIGGFVDHLSLFPGAAAVEVFKDQLDGYQLSKGTIQFTIEQPLPDKLIREIVQFRKNNIEAP